jgi:hypothetical protein
VQRRIYVLCLQRFKELVHQPRFLIWYLLPLSLRKKTLSFASNL